MNMRKAGSALGAMIAAILAATGAAQASEGCDYVNAHNFDISDASGNFDSTYSTGTPGYHFDVGDTLHVTSTVGSGGSFVYLMYGSTAMVSRHEPGSYTDDYEVTEDEVDDLGDNWFTQAYSEGGTTEVTVTCTPINPDDDDDDEEVGDDSAALDSIAENVGGQSAQASAGMMGSLSRAGFAAASSDDGTAVLTALDVGQATAAVKVDFATLWAGLNARGVVPGSTGWLGGQAMGAAGINFELSEGMIAGLFATVEGGAYADVDAGHSLDLRGAGIGANALFELGDGWNIQGLVAYSLIAYSLDANGVTGEFDAQRLVADISINGSVPVDDGIVFEPRAGLFLLREVQAAYTDSASVDHDEAVLQSYRAEAGGRLIFAVPGMSGTHVYTGAYGRYSDSGGASGMLSAGASVDLGTAALGLEFSLDNIGSTHPMGYGVTGRLAAEF